MSKAQFEEQQENFYSRLKDGDEYVNVSMTMDEYVYYTTVGDLEAVEGVDYTVNHVKQKNSKYKEDGKWVAAIKEVSKAKKIQTEIEQKINHK